jgi:hypothetical protein
METIDTSNNANKNGKGKGLRAVKDAPEAQSQLAMRVEERFAQERAELEKRRSIWLAEESRNLLRSVLVAGLATVINPETGERSAPVSIGAFVADLMANPDWSALAALPLSDLVGAQKLSQGSLVSFPSSSPVAPRAKVTVTPEEVEKVRGALPASEGAGLTLGELQKATGLDADKVRSCLAQFGKLIKIGMRRSLRYHLGA